MAMQTYTERIIGNKESFKKKNEIGEKAGHCLMIMQSTC